jgi:hypothetical protein
MIHGSDPFGSHRIAEAGANHKTGLGVGDKRPVDWY